MIANLRTGWHEFVAWSSRERFLVGAGVLRVVAGVTILYQYLINYEQRRFLYGPDGVLPYEWFLEQVTHGGGFSLYALGRSPLLFEVLFHVGVGVAALWTLGYRTRLLTPLNLLFWVSLRQRFPALWDGGDNLMQLVLTYALFANLGGASRREARPALAMLHNAAMLAIAIQLCLVYGVAGLTKVQGETWRNGTALYYALRAGEFTWPGRSEYLFHNSFLLTVLAYATVAFQVSFPFLVFLNRRTRVLAVCLGIGFHLGIALFMGLITFASFMMAVDLSLISDEEYHALGRLLAWPGKEVSGGSM